ncbi:MAG: anti-sigma factor [Pseudomonadota bacterium]|nr:anti-sigma factor [Pseudomonadota bacterium]
MANPPERDGWDDGDAAEYVLGTLDATERRAAARLAATDARFAEAVRAWEARLDALTEGLTETEPVAPPSVVWPAIAARLPGGALRGGAAEGAEVVELRRRLRYWRGTTGLAASLAALLAVAVIVPKDRWAPEGLFPQPGPATLRQAEAPPAQTGPQGTYVAVLQPGGAAPAFVAEVDLAAGTLSLRPIRPEPAPEGRVYEMWVVGGGRDAPVSLGLLADGGELPLDALAGPTDGSVLAVSVEPPGGSPTGLPTGDVVFTGELIRAD